MRVAVLSDIHANLTGARRRPRRDPVRGRGVAPGRRRGLRAATRTRSSRGSARSGAIGVRGNHDAAALGGREIESFNVDARRAMEWTRATIARRDEGLAGRPAGDASSARASRWSTAARGTRSGSTSPRRRSPGPAWPRWRRRCGLHGHTHLPIAYIEEDGRLETMSPGSGSRAGASTGGACCSTPAAWASRATASRRRVAGCCSTPDAGAGDLAAHGLRHRGRPGGDDARCGLPERLVGAPGVRALADERRPSPHLRAASPATSASGSSGTTRPTSATPARAS